MSLYRGPREHAIIESAVSSNRIEGVQIDPGRVRAVVLGKTHLHDRDEEEVRGYRQALKVIHGRGAKLSVSEETICEFHRVARAQIWDGWHEGLHDPWIYINYLFFILKTAYREFEDRLGLLKSPRGAKTEIIHEAVAQIENEFSLTALERACPGVSRDMIRRVLRQLKKDGEVECLGRGPGALWRKEKR